jgi:hypothetical protein
VRRQKKARRLNVCLDIDHYLYLFVETLVLTSPSNAMPGAPTMDQPGPTWIGETDTGQTTKPQRSTRQSLPGQRTAPVLRVRAG